VGHEALAEGTLDVILSGVAVTGAWRARLRSISGAALILVGAGVLTRVVTIATQMVIAQQFGTGPVSDAFFATEAISEIVLNVVVGGFVMAFIPVYSHYRADQDDEAARRFAGAFLLVFSALSIALALAMAVGAPVLTTVIAPGFDPATRDLTVSLIRIMSIAVGVIGLNGGLRGLLQAHRDFVTPELARLSYTSSLLVAAIGSSWMFGVFTLAWGMVVGAVLIATTQAVRAMRLGLLRLPRSFNHEGAKQSAYRVAPVLIAIAWTGVLTAIDRMVASGLQGGSVATLNYASRISLLPIGLVALPLKTAFFPTITDLAAQDQFERIATSIQTGVRVLLFVVVPACVGLAVLSQPLTRLLFERGAFDAAATAATGDVMVFYAIAVPAMSVIAFINGLYFAVLDLRPLIVLNAAGWGMNLVLSVAASRWMGVSGVALGTAVSAMSIAVIMIYDLRRRHLPTLSISRLARTTGTTLLASGGMGVALYSAMPVIRDWFAGQAMFAQLLQLTTAVLFGLVIYLVQASLLGTKLTSELRSSEDPPSVDRPPGAEKSGMVDGRSGD
jgi:putative peptidoglycan lipid II flippase